MFYSAGRENITLGELLFLFEKMPEDEGIRRQVLGRAEEVESALFRLLEMEEGAAILDSPFYFEGKADVARLLLRMVDDRKELAFCAEPWGWLKPEFGSVVDYESALRIISEIMEWAKENGGGNGIAIDAREVREYRERAQWLVRCEELLEYLERSGAPTDEGKLKMVLDMMADKPVGREALLDIKAHLETGKVGGSEMRKEHNLMELSRGVTVRKIVKSAREAGLKVRKPTRPICGKRRRGCRRELTYHNGWQVWRVWRRKGGPGLTNGAKRRAFREQKAAQAGAQLRA